MEGDKWMEIRNDRLKGMNYTELGKKYHVDPRTAKKYAESPQRPEYTLTAPKPNKLDAFKQQIDLWLEEAPYSAVRIQEKLAEMGFDGGYSIVKAYFLHLSELSSPMCAARRWIWMKKQQYALKPCLVCKDRWIGHILKTMWCLKMVD